MRSARQGFRSRLVSRRLDDLGGFSNCLVPDSGVGVGEGSFGSVEPGGDRGPPLDGDGGAPALVEVADGEDTVLVASLSEGVWLNPRSSRDRIWTAPASVGYMCMRVNSRAIAGVRTVAWHAPAIVRHRPKTGASRGEAVAASWHWRINDV